MRYCVAVGNDEAFLQSLEMLWALLPNAHTSLGFRFPAEVERELGLRSGVGDAESLPRQLAPKVDQLLRNGPHRGRQALAERLVSWNQSERIRSSLSELVHQEADIGVWACVDQYLRLRGDEIETWNDVESLLKHRGWQICSFRGHRRGVYSACFSRDGQFVCSRDHQNDLRRWDLLTGRLVSPKPVRKRRKMLYSPDGEFSISISRKKKNSALESNDG